MTEECRPNPETWFMELKLHFFVVSARKRDRDEKDEEPCSFLKTEISGENEGLFLCDFPV